MILLTDISFFQKPLEIVNLYEPNSTVKDTVQHFIRMYEPELLEDVLGLELYTALQASLQVNPIADRFQSLLFGDTYSYGGRLRKWKGIIETDTSYFSTGTGLAVMNPEWITAGVTKDADGNIIIADDATSFTVPGWISWEPIITRLGVGPLEPDVEYSYDIVTGTVALFRVGDSFEHGARLFVQFKIPNTPNILTFPPTQQFDIKEADWEAGTTFMEDEVTVYPYGVKSFSNPAWIGWEVVLFHQSNSIFVRGRDFSYSSTTGTITLLQDGAVFELSVFYGIQFKPRVTGSGGGVVVATDSGQIAYKHSFIADYVYYWYNRRTPLRTGFGTKDINPSGISNAADYTPMDAYRDMSDAIYRMWHYLDANRTVFPEWMGMYSLEERIRLKYSKVGMNRYGI
jgi:hypothetical protein